MNKSLLIRAIIKDYFECTRATLAQQCELFARLSAMSEEELRNLLAEVPWRV